MRVNGKYEKSINTDGKYEKKNCFTIFLKSNDKRLEQCLKAQSRIGSVLAYFLHAG